MAYLLYTYLLLPEHKKHHKAVGRAYNSTCDEDVSWEYYAEAAGTRTEIKRVDVSKFELNPLTYFPFYDDTYLLDNENVEKDGLYIPSIKLKEGLNKSYEWYCKVKPQLSSKFMDKVDFVLREEL